VTIVIPDNSCAWARVAVALAERVEAETDSDGPGVQELEVAIRRDQFARTITLADVAPPETLPEPTLRPVIWTCGCLGLALDDDEFVVLDACRDPSAGAADCMVGGEAPETIRSGDNARELYWAVLALREAAQAPPLPPPATLLSFTVTVADLAAQSLGHRVQEVRTDPATGRIQLRLVPDKD
jgi:hypothetical protein